MLIGTFNYKIDAKGRIPIPAPFRGHLKENYPDEELVLVAGTGNKYLYLHPISAWQRLSRKLKKKYFNARLRQLDTFLNAFSAHVSIDKQGRILIPENLKKFSELENEVVIIGNQNWIEIWSSKNWKKFTEEFIKSTESLEEMEKMFRSINIEDEED